MRVRLAEPAIQDLEAIGRWLGANAVQWLARTEDAFRHSFELLAEFPELGRPGRINKTREYPVNRTPYMLVYTILEDTLWVQCIIHKSRQWPAEEE